MENKNNKPGDTAKNGDLRQVRPENVRKDATAASGSAKKIKVSRKKQGVKAKVILLNLLTIALVCVIVNQIVLLALYYRDISQNDKSNQEALTIVNEFVYSSPTESAAPETTGETSGSSTLGIPTPNNTLDPNQPSPDENLSPEQQIERIKPYFDASRNAEMLEALRQQFKNDDIRAYIYIQGTHIAYPIVQASDNEYYLTRSVKKNKSSTGAIFADSEVNLGAPGEGHGSANTVIYGHNMKDNSMFHDLRFYIEREYYDNHRYIVIKYEDRTAVWEVFSAYQTNVGFSYTQVKFNSISEYETLLKVINKKSYVTSQLPVSPDDYILTLSTCTNVRDDERLVVHAKLINTFFADGK